MRKRKKKTKEDLRLHAEKRAKERYPALNFSFKKIRQAIQERRGARFLLKQSNSRTHWAVMVDGVEIPVVYDKTKKQVVTVLPQNALKNHDTPCTKIP